MQTDNNLFKKIFENFDKAFKSQFNMSTVDFFNDHYKHYLNDRSVLLLMIISLTLAYKISTQKEEDYIDYFQAAAEMESDSGVEVKSFLNAVIQIVEGKNMVKDSQSQVTSSRRIIYGFENQISEYENKIIILTDNLSNTNRELAQHKEVNDKLYKENSILKKRVEELTIQLTQLSDKNKKDLGDKFKTKELTYQKEIKDLKRKLQDLTLEKDQIQTKLIKTKQKKKILKEENLSQNKALSDISDNYIDKEELDRHKKEKDEMQMKLLELENNYVLEVSETKSLKSAIKKKEVELKMLKQRDKDYLKKINELRDRVDSQAQGNNLMKSNLTNPHLKGRNQLDLIGDDASDLSDFDLPGRGIKRDKSFDNINFNIEKLNKNLDQLRAAKKIENEELSQTIFQLRDEIKHLKKKINKPKPDDSNFVTNRTTSRLKSRDLSAIRKNPEMSDELVQKIIGMEKKIKTLTNENKYLHQSIFKNLSSYKYQADILFTTLTSYVNSKN